VTALESACICNSVACIPFRNSLAGTSLQERTYLFGDQDANPSVDEIVECVALYLRTPEGFMARDQRPKSLRASTLGRVPPLEQAALRRALIP
jgi:predicted metal-binding protein